MYNYLNGQITIITPKYIVIDINGVGYEINVANPYSYEINEKKQIYVYQYVKEDELTLYGFLTIEEKELFLDLISVKGIGPKTALVILAATNINEFKAAIKREDIIYLTKFPKVGKKSAQQIILDLEGKYNQIQDGQLYNDISKNNDEDLIEALMALGYDKKNIQKVLPKIDKTLTLEAKIKEGLKLLIKI